MNLTASDLFVTGIGSALFALLIRFISLAVYRLYFHPLKRFPGPKLAICTSLYEKYHEVLTPGRYTFKLKELHAKFGPIIRLNPDQLHCNDPDYYHVIYNTRGAKAEKPHFFHDAFGPLEMTFNTVDHDLHRLRRAALSGYFTKSSINNLIPHIHATIEHLCCRFEKAIVSGESINLHNAYAALTADVIHEYCFSTSEKTLSKAEFDAENQNVMVDILKQLTLSFQFPILPKLLFSLPNTVLKVLSPGYEKVLNDQAKMSAQIEAIKASDNKIIKPHRTTIFHALLDSDLPPAEKSTSRLRDEAFSLIIGSTPTIAHTLTLITYHLLSNPLIYAKLQEELSRVMLGSDQAPTLQALENAPYLTAVVYEGLRHATGLSHRLWRSYPNKALNYEGLDIPPGTVISATAFLIHNNENIFPDPKAFKPERWLGEDRHRLRHYLLSFSRGPRACIGMNLAYAEMYLALATIFRKFRFELDDVVRERDIDIVRDAFVPLTRPESKGVHVIVAGVQ